MKEVPAVFGREVSDDDKIRFVAALLCYAFALVALMSVALIAVARDANMGVLLAVFGLSLSVTGLAWRHLCRLLSPLEPVKVPPRRW